MFNYVSSLADIKLKWKEFMTWHKNENTEAGINTKYYKEIEEIKHLNLKVL